MTRRAIQLLGSVRIMELCTPIGPQSLACSRLTDSSLLSFHFHRRRPFFVLERMMITVAQCLWRSMWNSIRFTCGQQTVPLGIVVVVALVAWPVDAQDTRQRRLEDYFLTQSIWVPNCPGTISAERSGQQAVSFVQRFEQQSRADQLWHGWRSVVSARSLAVFRWHQSAGPNRPTQPSADQQRDFRSDDVDSEFIGTHGHDLAVGTVCRPRYRFDAHR